jgi:hypothetical protein
MYVGPDSVLASLVHGRGCSVGFGVLGEGDVLLLVVGVAHQQWLCLGSDWAVGGAKMSRNWFVGMWWV